MLLELVLLDEDDEDEDDEEELLLELEELDELLEEELEDKLDEEVDDEEELLDELELLLDELELVELELLLDVDEDPLVEELCEDESLDEFDRLLAPSGAGKKKGMPTSTSGICGSRFQSR
ncbi:MAG TPA: hypothetical protein VHB77_22320 [Planctomycetaceae bacterium]|nr:hypothetical protein [Planctomycetaceae bacterium]